MSAIGPMVEVPRGRKALAPLHPVPRLNQRKRWSSLQPLGRHCSLFGLVYVVR